MGTTTKPLLGLRAEDLMSRDVVIDDQGRPVGIVSSTDVLAAVTREGLRPARSRFWRAGGVSPLFSWRAGR
jgi:CBS-domain-containing membrane protein